MIIDKKIKTFLSIAISTLICIQLVLIVLKISNIISIEWHWITFCATLLGFTPMSIIFDFTTIARDIRYEKYLKKETPIKGITKDEEMLIHIGITTLLCSELLLLLIYFLSEKTIDLIIVFEPLICVATSLIISIPYILINKIARKSREK